MKKIAMLFNLNRHQFEYETEFDSEYTIDSIYNTLSKNYLVEKIEADKDFNWISKLKTYNPNLVFNICEGFHGPARESVYAAILEQLGLNYSGPDSTNMLVCHNKFLAKKLLKDDVLVPFGYVIKNKDEIKFLSNIKFPVIVKLNSEGSSMGMTKDSVVYNFDSLNKEVTRFIDTYNRGVLVEQYIKGQDLA